MEEEERRKKRKKKKEFVVVESTVEVVSSRIKQWESRGNTGVLVCAILPWGLRVNVQGLKQGERFRGSR